MTSGSAGTRDIECALLWKLARTHGWSTEVDVSDLAREAAVQDEQKARDIARNQLANRDYIRFHPGRDTIWLKGPPCDDAAYDLRDECGYSEIQIEATFGDYFDGF